jgi:hypothetical protein
MVDLIDRGGGKPGRTGTALAAIESQRKARAALNALK